MLVVAVAGGLQPCVKFGSDIHESGSDLATAQCAVPGDGEYAALPCDPGRGWPVRPVSCVRFCPSRRFQTGAECRCLLKIGHAWADVTSCHDLGPSL